MKGYSVFLGANTERGFFSLYDETVAALPLRRLYVLKGSAGCGKSSLMKRLAGYASDEGLRTVSVLCSGDPDSLDGLLLPERGIALFDGTSPHVLEPSLTGQRGFYIDLSRFYTSPASGLESLDDAYRGHYRKAYRYLASAGELEDISRCPEDAAAEIRRRAASLAARSLGRQKGGGSLRRCFTDAFTCRGLISLTESRRALAPRLISLTGGEERADLFMQAFLEHALERGRRVLLCLHPRNPKRIAHLLLPDAGLGLTTGEGDRRIHLEKLGTPPSEAEREERLELERLRQSLLSHARAELALAKKSHDALEEAVLPCIDFSAMTRETDALLRRMLDQ